MERPERPMFTEEQRAFIRACAARRERVNTREAIRATVRKGMVRPNRSLAAVLAEDTDDCLAAQLSCAVSVIWRARLMGWPHVDSWAADAALMADAVNADRGQLDSLLRPLARCPA